MSPSLGTITGLRDHLERAPADHAARLRLADLLAAEGQRWAARQVLQAADGAPPPLRRAIRARLAQLEELDGDASAAAAKWESLLADDIDDREAWRELERLSGLGAAPFAAPTRAAPTLASAEGVNVARYEIVEELGRGGSATVYLVRERTLGLLLALKVLHPHLAAPGRAVARARFFLEARAAAGLRHPGVVAIYDVDEEARTLAMEYLPGGTLRDRFKAQARAGSPGLPAAEALSIARSLLEALAYVHERRVLHGDITPRNVLLRAPGAAVLADFGMAQLAEADGPGDSEAEAPAGTPLYLAPEQFRGAKTSAATDLFSCGALLWEALVGRPMRAPGDLAAERLGGLPLPAPALRAAGMNPSLLALVERLTSSAPESRPRSAAVALQALSA